MRIDFPMDMHHGFKRFEDYTPWMGMYFTIAGDVYYFKFAGHSHAETCFESGCQLNLPRIISVCSCPALTTELEYIYSKSCSAIEPAENLTEAPSRAPESGRSGSKVTRPHQARQFAWRQRFWLPTMSPMMVPKPNRVGICIYILPQRLPRRCISPVQRESFIREMALSATEILSMRLGSTSPLLFPGSTMEHVVLPRS